jgi:hypothetical protein
MPSRALSGNIVVVFLRMCHHAASVLVLIVLRGGCGEKVLQIILPYSPAGLPAVGILGQGDQLLSAGLRYLW